MINRFAAIDEIRELLETMHQLLDPESGCPWDLQQTHKSLKGGLLEETYEALEAIDSENRESMAEEFGDLLIQLVFHGELADKQGAFSLADIAKGAKEKLIRRHPHVFCGNSVSSAEEVKELWDRVKADERNAKGEKHTSVLEGIPRTMPALAFSQAILGRADREGQRYVPNMELEELIIEWDNTAKDQQGRKEEALGALLLLLVEQSRKQGIDAEQALRVTSGKFYEQVVEFSRRNAEKT